ncbi:type I secretion system permease/ATPase [Vibrio sp. S4M6]|uniref:type I secretion system permease/ATPase n=1 Tax=Vibrio sinus TaxID=2946865 RepID=UPI00202A050A|nr:type I secretion system permease/ATPase [Vibrio sinus]
MVQQLQREHPIDTEAFPSIVQIDDVLSCFHQLGLEAQLVSSETHEFSHLPTPAIIEISEGQCMLAVHHSENEMQVYDFKHGDCVSIEASQLSPAWDGKAVLFAQACASGDGAPTDTPPEQKDWSDSGFQCLATLLQFHQMPVNIEQLSREQAGQALDGEALVRMSRSLGLKSRQVHTKVQRLAKTPLPAIAELTSGEFAVLGKVTEEEILLQSGETGELSQLSPSEFEALWTGSLILMTKRAPILGKGGKFDLSWFIPAVLKYKRILTEVLVMSLFLQLFALISPLFFQVVMDKVLVHQSMSTLNVLMIGLVTVAIFEVVMGGLRTYVFSHTANRIDVELGAKLFKHMLSLPMSYFQSRRVGETVARIRELENIREFITSSALTLVMDFLFIFVFLGVMWFYSPMLTLVVLASIPCYVLIAVLVTPILRNRLDEQFRRSAENQSFLVESVTGVETLKAMSVQPQAQRRWEEMLAAYVRSSFRAANLGNIAGQAVQLISKLVTAGILFMGAKAVIKGELTVGQLVAFNMFAGHVTAPVLRLSQMWNDFQQARISVERLGDVLNSPTEPGYDPNRASLDNIDGHLSFDQVTFRYQPDKPEILRRISLDIPAGQTVGIVGPSGSGKSTLTKLVQRMFVPESGRVMVDGFDLAMVDTSWLRTQVGVVLQENLLFNRSVRDNIALSDPGMSMERVVEAAKLAGAHDFILGLPEGYDTQLEERGANLSGGQRQRVAIARALVSNPRILILDEATSALDYESESIIQQNMQAICQNRTVLIIAHRLSTVRHADRILTIESGEVVEDGSHDELLLKGGRYARLCAIQSGEQAEEGNA